MKEGISDTYIENGYLIILTLKGYYYKVKVDEIMNYWREKM